MLNAKYDRRADVLYVSTERNGPAVASEGEHGIIWRYLVADGTLVGLTVMDFGEYWRRHLPSLIQQMAAQFHVPPAVAKDTLERVSL